MKYCNHHGGGQEDEIHDFSSPFEIGEHLRKYLWKWGVEVNFQNIQARKYTKNGDPSRGWKELWIVSIEGFGVVGWSNGWFKEEE